MCGILGRIADNLLDERVVNCALGAMHNRGPDDLGFEVLSLDDAVTAKILLGHTRLSIIDLSSAGHQPMWSGCRNFCLVFNGEIYNYKELRSELKELGYSFSSDSDTEVLLAAWLEWREKCLPRLEGMFAFVVFDKIKKSVTCVRDGFGIKPFLYAHDNGDFCFASDINALLELRVIKPKLNWQRSYDYLVQADYDSNEDTFIAGVRHLMPGCLMELDLTTKQLSVPSKWWSPVIKERKDLSFADAAELVRERFLANVRLHLRSDVPLGAALSGGVDSSAVVCAMRHLEPDLPINTFSYVARGTDISEESWVDLINNQVAANGHKVVATSQDLLRDLDDLIEAQGEPFGSTSIYVQYRVFQLAKEAGVTVTLDGQGADELLAGYRGYPLQRIKSLLETDGLISALKFSKKWAEWPGRSQGDAVKLLGGAMLSDSFQRRAKASFMTKPTPTWLNSELCQEHGVRLVQPHASLAQLENKGRRAVEFMARSLQHAGLPQLLRHGDRNSMRFSVESRVPFLTLPLAELLLSLPEEYLISSKGETKSIFRAAMRGIVPDAILDRKDKIGFATPEQIWLCEAAPVLRRWLESCDDIPFLNQKALLKEFDAMIAGKQKFSWQLWRWVNFVRWYERIFNK